jgi:aspartate/methionine/tyrosine aminotransferase
MVQFPYMFFARSEGQRAPFNLTQSGMPAADHPLLREGVPIDLGFAGAEALPELERRLAQEQGLPPERLLVTLGASAAMQALAWRYFRAGVRVVSETPSYDPLRALPPALGADLRCVSRRMEQRWQIDPAEVRAQLEARPRGSGPGHVFLTNPHNPSGALLPDATLRALAGEAERAGGVLISCEVYLEFAPPRQRSPAFRLAPNAISIGSLTKAYGLGPLRTGWIALGEGLARERAAIQDSIFLSYVDPPTMVLRAALRALDALPALRQRCDELARTSKPLLERWLASTEGVRGIPPELGLTSFPRLEGIDDTRALYEFLVREEQVGVVPGEFFAQPGHVRIGYGLEPARLEEALERLTRGLRAFRSRSGCA